VKTADARWVDTDAALTEVIVSLRSEPTYGLDTEFVSERTYWPRLCLVQLAWPGGIALVDALACDMRALDELLQAPAMMVTHAGSADLPILERTCGHRPASLFDTQLAAGFIGLGSPSLMSLVSALLGERLDKSEQLADWSRRPLSEAARRYAASDVIHLLALAAELRARLGELGRIDWVTAECEALRITPARDSDPEVAWWRIKGARSLRGERAGVAQSVAAWRERRARELDRPARHVLSDLVLAGVAARPPRSVKELADLRGAERLPKPMLAEVVAAVEAGFAMPRDQLRLPPKLDDDAALDAAIALLSAWSAQQAAAAQIEPRLLATRDDVRAKVNGRPGRLDEGWRADMVGDRISELIDGRAVLRLVEGGRSVKLESTVEAMGSRP
jgi:ribonuclease D